ncbi:MAG: hypothetical protein LBQ22_06970 [Bacteroidales bacterium]|jgi:DNA polymerase elongation subunit (family B)|nr:hypothetical protein [Bacteroidales bacterium]
MDFFDEYINAEEIKAETIISLLGHFNFIVDMAGIFYRNYSGDLVSVSNSDNYVYLKLARDSLFEILPESLFFEEDTISSKKIDYKKFKEEKEKIRSLFQPFDTKYFNLSLSLEKKLNEIAETETDILTGFLFDKSAITNSGNRYLKRLDPLLPAVSEIRGNKRLIKDILESIFEAKVDINIINKKEQYNDDSDCIIMIFIIHIQGLSSDEYKIANNEAGEFFEFFHQYFLPFETEYQFKLRDYNQNFILGEQLTLDYNTKL